MNYKNVSLLLVMILFFSLAHAQKGKIFPNIKAITFDGNDVELPESAKGKRTIVGMAYSRKSQDDLQTWLGPVYNEFMNKENKFQKFYNLNLFFTIMFSKTTKNLKNQVIGKIKKDLPIEMYPKILVFEGKLKEYKEKLKMTDKTKPYIFILDEKGKIIHKTSGVYNRKKLDDIIDKVM